MRIKQIIDMSRIEPIPSPTTYIREYLALSHGVYRRNKTLMQLVIMRGKVPFANCNFRWFIVLVQVVKIHSYLPQNETPYNYPGKGTIPFLAHS